VRIASWNVNSLRARAERLFGWLEARAVDVALLQETKCGDGDFPFATLESMGYEAVHHGVDHWNGVAVVSRVGLEDVERGFSGAPEPPFDEPRLIAATCGGVRCRSVYVPNGRGLDDPHFTFKLRWLERLAEELRREDVAAGPSLVAGDFNVGPADIDFYDPKRWAGKKHATPEERSRVQAIVDLGFVDLARNRYPCDPMFTWWNHAGTQFGKNRGLRIDLALASPELAGRVEDIWVDRPARDPLVVAPGKPSDHAPLIVDIT
jgi:exodeoxyribonuclease-3